MLDRECPFLFTLIHHLLLILSVCEKGLKGRLTEHQHKLYQVLDEGKHLLLSVCSPALENQLALLGEHWLNNTSKVNKELQRLEAILKHWTRSESQQAGFLSLKRNPILFFFVFFAKCQTFDNCVFVSCRYQRECADLSQWLQSALERLEFWNTQAVLVPQELETVRDHLAAFLVSPHPVCVIPIGRSYWSNFSDSLLI